MNLPKEGTNVEIVLDNSFAHGYMERETAKRIQRTVTVSGVVVATPSWMKNQVDLTIINSITKARNYLSLNKILSIGGIDMVHPNKTPDKILSVVSSKTGEVYTVRHDGVTKRWSCTCIGFQFHKKCRHTTRAAEAA